MFINNTKLKKMLKMAYKDSGLLMSREGDNLLIGGGSFLIRTDIGKLTKKEKAILIELIGNLPENHETFRATELGEQQELSMPDLWNIDQKFGNGNDNYEPTYVLVRTIDGLVRGIQNTENNSVFFCDDFLMSAIQAPGSYKEGCAPEGPRIWGNMMALWKNEWTTFAILKYDLKNEEFSSLLENMELYACKEKK